MAWACAMMKLYSGLFEELRFQSEKYRELSLLYKLFLKAHRSSSYECIYWYRVGRARYSVPGFGQKSESSMRWRQAGRSPALLGMLIYDLTWHRYILQNA